MLDNLKIGYGGTKTEMERLLADAQELSGVEYDINNLGDVYSAIHVIQEDLGLTGVAAKEASTTFTGSFNAMKASAENLMANLALGEDIGPALDQLGTSIQGFLFNNLFPMVGNVLSSLPDLLSGVSSIIIGSLNMIANNADQIVQMGIDFVVALVQSIVTATPYLIEAAFSLITALGSAIVNTDWAQVGNDIITGIKDALDMAAGEILGQDTATIDGFLQGITAGLPNLLQSGVEIITNLANSIISNLPMMITTAGTLINQFASFILQNLPVILQSGATLILNLVNGIVSNLPQIVASVVKVIASFVATVASNLPTILAQGITIIGKLVAGLIQAIPKIIAAIPQIIQSIVNSFGSYDWGSIGKNILQGIADGISNAVGVVVDAAKNAAQAAFDAAKNLLGIESPSKKGYWIGEMLDLGFANGISENEDLVSSAISDLSTNASTQLLLASKSSTFGYEAGTSSDDKMDILLAMLSNYLPEIAENKGVDVQQLYNGLNRQLGWAIS